MFDKQYRFKGIHAVRVDALTSVFDESIIRMSWVTELFIHKKNSCLISD